MSNTGTYLYDLIKQEDVSVEELMKICNKSRSTVLNWLRDDKNQLPKFSELAIISQRLGITVDDILFCKYTSHYGMIAEVKYKDYLVLKAIDCTYLSSSVLDSSNYFEIIDSFIDDRILFKNILNNALAGKKVNQKVFNEICNNLKVNYAREFGQEGIYLMSYNDIYYLKAQIEDIKNGEIYDESQKDYIFMTNANWLIIILANKHPELVKKYLSSLCDFEWEFFCKVYVSMIEEDETVDKKNIILKAIVKNNIDVLNDKNNKDYDKLYTLLRRLI